MKDEPNIELRCCWRWAKITIFLDKKMRGPIQRNTVSLNRTAHSWAVLFSETVFLWIGPPFRRIGPRVSLIRTFSKTNAPIPKKHPVWKQSRRVINVLTLVSQTYSLRTKKLCCMCLRTTKQWSRWSLKEGVPQWDIFPRFTELRMIGCSIESTWTQKIQIKYIDTKNQLADMLTTGNFTRDEWNHLLCWFNVSHFSSPVCSDTMAKRSHQDSGEERVTAKSRSMMGLIARVPSHVSSSTSVSPVKRSHGNQNPWSTTAEKEERPGRPDVGSDRKTACDYYYHEKFMEIFSSANDSEWDDDHAWSS